MIDGKIENKKINIREFYTESSKLYLIDYAIWVSMFVSKDTITYKPLDHPDWVRFYQHYEEIRLGDE